MRVLMIAPQPFFEPRGTPISVYQRLSGLSALGYDVDVVTYHLGREVDIPRVKIHRIPNIPLINNIQVGPSWPKVLLDLVVFCKAILMLLFNRYDILHSHEEAGYFCVILSKIFRIPHLYDMHSCLSMQLENSKFGYYKPLVKLFERLDKLVINTCNSMITIGTDLEARSQKINPGVNQIRVENLPIHIFDSAPDQKSGADLKEKLELSDRKVAVYTGTFEYYQGLELLFESVELVKEQVPDIAFVLVGGKPEQVEYWQAEIRKNQLEDSVIFVGIVTPAETLIYLEMADILVSPRTEGLSVPLKIYTYLYSGKPIVATNLLAHTQILNDDNAVLVAPRKEAFADGIVRLVRNPELGRQLGLTAHDFAKEKYNSVNYLSKLEGIYQRTLQLPAKPSKETTKQVIS